MTKEIGITITPVWAMIELARKRIQTELGEMLNKADLDASIICASELFENAIKYGDSVDEMQFIQFLLKLQGSKVMITVSNGVTNPQDLRNVRESIDKINSGESPERLYFARLKEMIGSSQPQKSRLGLFRIAHETKFSLSYKNTSNTVIVNASLNIG